MFRALRIAGLAAAMLFLTRFSLDACGDKLLVLGRGVRFQDETAEYPASILHLMTSRIFDPATLTDTNLQSFLGRAGHKLRSVRTAKELQEALGSGRYDLVVIDVGEAPAFEAMIESASSRSRNGWSVVWLAGIAGTKGTCGLRNGCSSSMVYVSSSSRSSLWRIWGAAPSSSGDSRPSRLRSSNGYRSMLCVARSGFTDRRNVLPKTRSMYAAS